MLSAPAASAARYAPSRRDRAVSFVLAVLAGGLMIFVLITMSAMGDGVG
jgi:ABC-type lipoprotein release transport system permease subunit